MREAIYGVALLNFYDMQFVNCQRAIRFDLILNVRNCLFSSVGTTFYTYADSASIDLQNVTVRSNLLLVDIEGYENYTYTGDMGDWPNFGLSCANSLIDADTATGIPIGVPGFSEIDTNTTFFVGETGIYQTVGAGGNYLANGSPYRGVGTTNIDSTLLADLRQLTTHPPVYLTNTITTNTTLGPMAARDTNASPDLGYHYPPIDYLDACGVTNATLTLTNGVVLANYSYGIWLQNGGKLISQGTANLRNYLVHFHLVQEQTNDLWNSSTISSDATHATPFVTQVAQFTQRPVISMSFTTIAAENNCWDIIDIYDGGPFLIGNLSLTNCEIYTGGGLLNITTSSNNPVVNLQNNLFHRCSDFEISGSAQTTAFNNLFIGTDQPETDIQAGTGSAVSKNNAFDNCYVSLSGTYSNNAYLNGCSFDSMTAETNSITTNLVWLTGPLGTFYQATNGPLSNMGNTSASNVGLYHFTTQVTQVPETNSIVDIGYHYVALGTNGLPLDTDGDGIPDYIEDSNGNGTKDSGETDWQIADTDGDGVNDRLELLYGTDPLNPASFPRLRLGYWNFDTTLWVGDQGQTPIHTNGLQFVTNGWIMNAVQVDSNTPTRLAYNIVQTNGNTYVGNQNINLTNGSFRFRFKPNWNNGSGPTLGELICIGDKSSSNGWWALVVTNDTVDGTTPIVLMTESNGVLVTNLTTGGVGWTNDSWFDIVLAYSQTNCFLYVTDTNGNQISIFGSGITVYPSSSESGITGINIGSDTNGSNQVKGSIDELETFNYPLDYYVGPIADNRNSVPTHQELSAVSNAIAGSKPLDVIISKDLTSVYVKRGNSLVAIDAASWTSSALSYLGSVYGFSMHGIAVSQDGSKVYATDTAGKLNIYAVSHSSGHPVLTFTTNITVGSDPEGVAISSNATTAYVCLSESHQLAVVNLTNLTVITNIDVAEFPYHVTLSTDEKTAYVSDYCGQIPLTAFPGGDQHNIYLLINTNGIGTNGVVSFVDLIHGTNLTNVTVGVHPSAMALSADDTKLYVANAESNSVSVISTTATNVSTNILIPPYPGCPYGGSAPNALTLSTNGSTLYVALGNVNAVAAIDTSSNVVEGFIPNDWYPDGVATDGTNLFVANAWGLGLRFISPYLEPIS